MIPFSEGLRKARECKGLSQAELARRIGVVRQQVNSYESGRFVPQWELICKIADTLGISLDKLAGRNGKGEA